jgi:hypothetical protein
MSQFQLTGVAVFPTKDRPCCELCSRRIKNQYILVGNGTIFPSQEGKMMYGGTLRVGSECAKKVLDNPKFEVQMQSMENFVTKLRIISAIPGTCFWLEGEPREINIKVSLKTNSLKLQLTPQALVIRLREKVQGRMVRTPNPITEDQLTYLQALLGVVIEPFKTYFLNEIFVQL